MHESERHQELWSQLHREVIRGLEEELELLRIRESDLQQSAKERETVLLELLEAERTARLAAETAAGTGGAHEAPMPRNTPRAAASARADELLARLSLTDPRIPELESALRACEEELARMRNRKAFRAIAALARLKSRLLGRK